ncbi:hypothetical protein OAS39_05865 [Pirellulales bacterium]|nr:hypothetical protein [Pirellulales bacterium]
MHLNDPCAANEPPPETIAIEEEGVSGGGAVLIQSARINRFIHADTKLQSILFSISS